MNECIFLHYRALFLISYRLVHLSLLSCFVICNCQTKAKKKKLKYKKYRSKTATTTKNY